MLANLHFAKSNLSGAVYHYEECLNQIPNHVEAFSLLRAVKCQLKFDKQAQSSAQEGTSTAASTSMCNQGPRGIENTVIKCRKVSVGGVRLLIELFVIR
jgi:hypothetical protein